MQDSIVPCRPLASSAFPLLLIFLLTLSISGCSNTRIGQGAVSEYNTNPLTVTIPSNASAEFVEQSMVSALQGRQWSVQSRSPQKAVGRLLHRGWDATVTLVSDGSIIRIMSDATRKDLESGEPKPGVPFGWLRNIQKDLSVALGVPVPQ